MRQKMDGQGWVDIAMVAGFKRVRGITGDVEMVKDALLWSAVLDVDVERMRVRRRFGWELYTLNPPAMNGANEDGSEKIEKEDGKGKRKEKEGVEGGKEEKTIRVEQGSEEDEPALGVVSASGFGGALRA